MTEAIRILVLSLGNNKYRTANYRFEGKERVIVSPFVAEALIEEFNPNVIIVIGTVKSAWDAFYDSYKAKSDDAVHRENMEYIEQGTQRLGKDSTSEEIDEFMRRINSIYKEYLNIKGKPIVKVCITKYGLTEEELKDTYNRINKTWKDAIELSGEENTVVDVAFDITHSFRSMPIYNLVVLNYYKLLSENKVRISHVYYGNLEVSKENGEIAQIVDMKEILHLLDFSNAASEFRNTGSVYTLSTILDEETPDFVDDEMKKALTDYDWAVQTNSFTDMETALDGVFKLTDNLAHDIEFETDSTRDIKFYISTVIKEALQCESYAEWKELLFGEKQLRIGNWYLRQKQYGRAIINGCEALRSLLVSIDERYCDKPECIKNQTERRDVYSKLIEENNLRKRLDENIESIGTETYEFWEQLIDLAPKCQEYRNILAHNLVTDNAGVTVAEELETITKIKTKIKTYYKLLNKLNECRKNRDDPKCAGIIQAFNLEAKKKTTNRKKSNKIVICGNKQLDNARLLDFIKSDKATGMYRINTYGIRQQQGEKAINSTRKARIIYEKLKYNELLNNENNKIYFVDIDKESERIVLLTYLKYRLAKEKMDASFIICDTNKDEKCPENLNFITEETIIPTFEVEDELKDYKIQIQEPVIEIKKDNSCITENRGKQKSHKRNKDTEKSCNSLTFKIDMSGLDLND